MSLYVCFSFVWVSILSHCVIWNVLSFPKKYTHTHTQHTHTQHTHDSKETYTQNKRTYKGMLDSFFKSVDQYLLKSQRRGSRSITANSGFVYFCAFLSFFFFSFFILLCQELCVYNDNNMCDFFCFVLCLYLCLWLCYG